MSEGTLQSASVLLRKLVWRDALRSKFRIKNCISRQCSSRLGRQLLNLEINRKKKMSPAVEKSSPRLDADSLKRTYGEQDSCDGEPSLKKFKAAQKDDDEEEEDDNGFLGFDPSTNLRGRLKPLLSKSLVIKTQKVPKAPAISQENGSQVSVNGLCEIVSDGNSSDQSSGSETISASSCTSDRRAEPSTQDPKPEWSPGETIKELTFGNIKIKVAQVGGRSRGTSGTIDEGSSLCPPDPPKMKGQDSSGALKLPGGAPSSSSVSLKDVMTNLCSNSKTASNEVDAFSNGKCDGQDSKKEGTSEEEGSFTSTPDSDSDDSDITLLKEVSKSDKAILVDMEELEGLSDSPKSPEPDSLHKIRPRQIIESITSSSSSDEDSLSEMSKTPEPSQGVHSEIDIRSSSTSDSDKEMDAEVPTVSDMLATEFLQCDLADKTPDCSNSGLRFNQSQNYQLNCQVKVVLRNVEPKDITSTFCYLNGISGISGFFLRRHLASLMRSKLMQKVLRERRRRELELSRSPSPLQEGEVKDPFVHSVFAPLIEQDHGIAKPPKNKSPLLGKLLKMKGKIYKTESHLAISQSGAVNQKYVYLPKPQGSLPAFAPNKRPDANITGEQDSLQNCANMKTSGAFPNGPTILTNVHGFNGSTKPHQPPHLRAQTVLRPMQQSFPTNSWQPYLPANCIISQPPRLVGGLQPASLPISMNVGITNPPPLLLLSSNTGPPGLVANQALVPGNENPVVQAQVGDIIGPVVLSGNPLRPASNPVDVNGPPSSRPPGYSMLVTSSAPSTAAMQQGAAGPVLPTPSLPTNASGLGASPVLPPLRMRNAGTFSLAQNRPNPSQPPQLVKMVTAPLVDLSSHSPVDSAPAAIMPAVPVVGIPQALAAIATPSPVSTHFGRTLLSPVAAQNKEQLENDFDEFITFHLSQPTENVENCGSQRDLSDFQSKVDEVAYTLKLFIKLGFPTRHVSLSNAAYQMLLAKGLCCQFHALEFVNTISFNKLGMGLSLYERYLNAVKLPLPHIPISDLPKISKYDMYVLKRLVFAVDKNSRKVLFPLPPFCIPKENNLLDKITVVFLVSLAEGMGPGLIVFPHSTLTRDLRLSLECLPSGHCWSIGAHQSGGLTQSMVLEYLRDSLVPYMRERHTLVAHGNYLTVDWWWCISHEQLATIMPGFRVQNLQQVYPPYLDPLDVALGLTLQRMWGSTVRKWSSLHGSLNEVNFPQFFLQVMSKLTSPFKLIELARSSGLFPIDVEKAARFVNNTDLSY